MFEISHYKKLQNNLPIPTKMPSYPVSLRDLMESPPLPKPLPSSICNKFRELFVFHFGGKILKSFIRGLVINIIIFIILEK